MCVCAWMWRCDGHGRVDISNPPNPLNILIDCDLFGSCQRDAYPVRRRSSLDLHFDTAIEAARGGFASAPTAPLVITSEHDSRTSSHGKSQCWLCYPAIHRGHPIDQTGTDFTSTRASLLGETFVGVDVIRTNYRPTSPYSLMQRPIP